MIAIGSAMVASDWKRRLLMVVLACDLGLAAAFAFGFVAGLVRPCEGERLSCSMTEIVGFIYIPVFSGAALLAFAAAALWKNSTSAITWAALIPLVPFLLLFAITKYFEISVREYNEIRERDVQELLQIAIPIVLTLVVPWIVLQHFAGRTETEKKAHG